MKRFIDKYSWTLVAAWFIAILIIALLTSCQPAGRNNYEKSIEHHVIIDIERDYHQNSVYPIDPVYSITLEDSSKIRSSYQYQIGDTVTYIIYTRK